jgi:DNA helicase-2/ATP-dependent DNA helicase PcrA
MLEAGGPPWAMRGITFTNKAATEMKNRVEAFLPYESSSIWISTFHSACVRILRRDIERIGYSRSFTILDSDDQQSVVKDVIGDLNLSDKQFVPKSVLEQIGRAKDVLITPEDYTREFGNDINKSKIARIYELYQKRLVKNNALDFDDIIMLTIRLFNECGDILNYYQNRFTHVLVDEYQDTNAAQYALISLLSGKWKNLCVVGDDDQSIYSWRGADIGNILSFEKEFINTRVIKLEQNYRSTKTILSAAYGVIHKNVNRKDKKLWTENENGEAIQFVNVANEHEEAAFVARTLKQLRREQGTGYGDFAILYRINAQSRAMENTLAREAVPYRIIGGYKFFERKEIKDIIAYLRILQNPSDDISFKRVINVPRRGIGAATIEKLEAVAGALGVSMYEAAAAASRSPGDFPDLKASLAKLEGFTGLIAALTGGAAGLGIDELLENVLTLGGIYASYENDHTDEARVRLENIMEFKSEVLEFEKNYVDDGMYYADSEVNGSDGGVAAVGEGDGGDDPAAKKATLAEFLSHISLISDIDGYDESDEKVSLMTMHSAKGLEYNTVFIIGAEEGILPGVRSFNEPERLEEERRLCYVAITRAKKLLYVTRASSRTLFGNTTYNRPSRFISDIPDHLIYERQGAAAAINPGRPRGDPIGQNPVPASSGPRAPSPFFSGAAPGKGDIKPDRFGVTPAARSVAPVDEYENGKIFAVGDAVGHKKYGDGVITKRYRDKGDFILEIEFNEAGLKRFIESMVKLKKEE